MISANQIQLNYNKLYACMRNYIWDFRTVEVLANLEVDTYKRFPNIDDIAKDTNQLKQLISTTDVFQDDLELQKSFNRFEDLLSDIDTVYADLQTFRKVVVV